MALVSIWCRHVGDNIIGIGNNIPWNIPSDLRRFRKITQGKTIVVGKKTYESFPNKTLPNRKIFILTSNNKYEVSDKEKHSIVSNIEKISLLSDDVYIAGGASVYNAFFLSENYSPDIVIDCVFKGNLIDNLEGQRIDVTTSVNILTTKYIKYDETFELDDVETYIWAKKKEYFNLDITKNIISYLQSERTNNATIS
jgi:dihydrofolate reductase